ncbi:MAG TPA: hypothetical protein VFK16_01390 [Gemmatimonadaceae bacterium]|jgi:hypothetical protein|nr:hypothetical protein [Gemmatimonadaceae bacterium]
MRRPSGGERVFTDERGRTWSAVYVPGDDGAHGAVVFSCVSEVRQSARAVAVELPGSVGDIEEETLRAWLSIAPRIGTLT